MVVVEGARVIRMQHNTWAVGQRQGAGVGRNVVGPGIGGVWSEVGQEVARVGWKVGLRISHRRKGHKQHLLKEDEYELTFKITKNTQYC